MFRDVTLGEVLDFYNGKAIKPGGVGRFPVYGSNGIIGGSDDSRFDHGIVIGRVGAYCGSVAYCPGRFWASDNTIVATPKVGANSTRFFAYMLLAMNLNRHAGGAAQPLVTQSTLKGVHARIPDAGTQYRIAAILSAYDDLIETNARRIAVLEEMARRIYEEWFVRCRFPGHENMRMVDSALGRLPEGWLISRLGDVADYISRGLTPKYDDAAQCIVINQKCIRNQRLDLGSARRQRKSVPNDKRIRFGDVLINSTGVGTLGRVAQVLEATTDCTVDTHVSIVRPSSDFDFDFFGLSLLSRQAHFESQGVGATGQTELSRSRIAETQLVIPPLIDQQRFGELVGPMRRLAITLATKNRNLRTTRDLLLPKLISGELDVSELPDPEAAAA